VFSHEVEHRIEYPSFSDLVEVYAELHEEGAFEVRDGRAELLLEPERAKQKERLSLRRRRRPGVRHACPSDMAGLRPRAVVVGDNGRTA
jgi:hypothetical protein